MELKKGNATIIIKMEEASDEQVAINQTRLDEAVWAMYDEVKEAV